MTRVAAVDCGTNTIKLLVADLDPVTGTEHELVREMRIVPITKELVFQLVVATLLPMAPLLLTMISLEELLGQFLRVVF